MVDGWLMVASARFMTWFAFIVCGVVCAGGGSKPVADTLA
eukprot:COSAG06_NODE_43185_length_374_cov_0.938182_1_plen_39_part_01